MNRLPKPVETAPTSLAIALACAAFVFGLTR